VADRAPLDVLEAIHSTPARRYLKPDPIPDDVLWDILDAAIRGPSGGNQQGWGWVVVTDPEIKRQIHAWYLEGWQRAYGVRRDEILASEDGAGLGRRNFLSADHLANHLHEAPVWVMPVLRNAREGRMTGSSVYGAVQNLMLAARAHGIGATLTSLYAGHEDEVRDLLGLPEDARTMGLIPLGYPARGRWAQPKRLPVDEVTHWDRWGAQRTRPAP
jgi:nitroreductase